MGGLGNEVLYGTNEVNGLSGNYGDDALGGRGGADVLSGGGGHDTLTGAAGADRFVFDVVGPDHADVVRDFTRGDTIALEADAFGLRAGTDVSVTVTDHLPATSSGGGHLVFVTTSSELCRVNARCGQSDLLATLAGVTDLSSHDAIAI